MFVQGVLCTRALHEVQPKCILNQEIVLAAVEDAGAALEFASADLRDDEEVGLRLH